MPKTRFIFRINPHLVNANLKNYLGFGVSDFRFLFAFVHRMYPSGQFLIHSIQSNNFVFNLLSIIYVMWHKIRLIRLVLFLQNQKFFVIYLQKKYAMIDTEKRAEYIEEVGLFFETLGLTRMAGRIHGYLMVNEKEMVCFDELVESLQASKSSISTNLKSLQQIRFIKAITLSGDRKTYYCLSPDLNWSQYYEQRIKAMDAMINLFGRGLELRSNKDDKPSQWLAQTLEFYEWLTGEISIVLKRWEEYRLTKEKNKKQKNNT